MRLYPPVWTLTRKAVGDYETGGFRIPAGTVVGMSQFVMHRDARWYPEPAKFDPHRWSAEETAARPRFSYFPFGGGPRQCIGEGFAWVEATLLLATLCQRFTARIEPGYRLRLQPLITLRPRGGMPMLLSRRSHGDWGARAPEEAAFERT
jgi:cytochrome P450